MKQRQVIILGDLITIKHGYAFSGQFITSQKTENILVTPGNFKIGGGFKSDKFKYYSDKNYPKEYEFKGGELIVTMTDLSKETDTLGFPALIPSDDKKYLHNQRVGLVKLLNNKIDKKYLYWKMCTREYQEFIANSASGTSVMHTSPKRICEYQFLLPSICEQKAIASVLSSLDDKIDLLHRQNKTLESMAETLFRQWFVEEAQENQDELPLKELVDVIDNRGKTPPYFVERTAYPIIEVNALTQDGRNINYSLIRKFVDQQTFNTWFRKHLNQFDVLVSTVGSIGAFAMFFGGTACVAQNVIGLRAKDKISNYYLYQWLLSHSDEIKELDIGSVQPSIKVPHLLSLPMKIPNKEKIIEFDTQSKTIVQKILNNCNAITHLEKLRDVLLPKLMSGDVRVQYTKE